MKRRPSPAGSSGGVDGPNNSSSAGDEYVEIKAWIEQHIREGYVDRNIVKLVRALNAIPHLVTSQSCGGHPAANSNQLPQNHFVVSFFCTTDAAGWSALHLVAKAVQSTWTAQVFPELVDLDEDPDKEWTHEEYQAAQERLEIIAFDLEGGLLFDLRGHDVDTDRLAVAIRRRLARERRRAAQP